MCFIHTSYRESEAHCLVVFTRTVRVIGPTISAALAMLMFPVSSSIWNMFPSFPGEERKQRQRQEEIKSIKVHLSYKTCETFCSSTHRRILMTELENHL